MTELGQLTWTEVAVLDRKVLLVPLGSTEQHGPHLPSDTDTLLATELATRAALITDALVAPAVPYGASGEHEDFPGTISVGTQALAELLIELGRSAIPPFEHLVFVNAHGGNGDALTLATEVLHAEGRDVRRWSASIPDGDAHAGHTETSLMLAIEPDSVQLHRLEPGNTTPIDELLPAIMADGVRAHSPSGVLGDPTAATAHHGQTLLAHLVSSLVKTIASLQAD